jgi:hypothetical protein
MAYVRLIKDGISVGTTVHNRGDVVEVPDRRADAMVRYGEATIVPQPGPSHDAAPPIEHATIPPKAERAVAPRQR